MAKAKEPMFEPRRAEAGIGTVVTYTATDGTQKTIEADADGVFRPESPEEVAVLDSFGLAHARKAAQDGGKE